MPLCSCKAPSLYVASLIVNVIGLDFQNRIPLEEVGWLELEASRCSGHDGKVFLTWNVMETHSVPHCDILALNFSIPVKQWCL